MVVEEVCLMSRRGKDDPFHVRYRVKLGSGEIIKHTPSPDRWFEGYEEQENGDIEEEEKGFGDNDVEKKVGEVEEEFVELDGDFLEGGGQILRIALALSSITQTPIRIMNIRAGRNVPGLKTQHLAGVRAVRDVDGGVLEGGKIKSMTLSFSPKNTTDQEEDQGGEPLNIRSGTAASVTLIIQGLLPVLIFSRSMKPESFPIRIEGGTNVNWSPPLSHQTHTLFPLLRLMGVSPAIQLIKQGFYPRGGGEINLSLSKIDDGDSFLSPLELDTCQRECPLSVSVSVVGGGNHPLISSQGKNKQHYI